MERWAAVKVVLQALQGISLIMIYCIENKCIHAEYELRHWQKYSVDWRFTSKLRLRRRPLDQSSVELEPP